MGKNRIITVQDIPITVTQADNIEDYICITDIAAAKSDNSRAAYVVKNWMRNRNTLEFFGTWVNGLRILNLPRQVMYVIMQRFMNSQSFLILKHTMHR